MAFNFVTGSVTIGFEAKDASGNWIVVDNFRLARVGDDLSAELTEAIQNAETSYGNATGKENQQLKDAISAAQAVASKSSATADEQASVIVVMEQAIDIYLRANADSDNPLDMTDHITNPSFETGDLTGWTSSGMSMMNNAFFDIKQGTWYVEKWTGRGSAVGDARLSQQLTNMPAGRYRLTVAAQNIQEDTPKKAQSGAWIFAGSHTEAVTVRNTYTLEFVQVADVLEIGFEAKGATGNWISVDNFRLEYIGDDMNDVKAELSSLIAQGDALDGSDKKLSDGTYIPNTMTGASKYFAKGLYDSSVSAMFETAGKSLRVGIKCTNAPAWYWTMFDHFRLYFFGGTNPTDGIDVVNSGTRTGQSGRVYDLQGRRIDALHKKGLYIVDGKKVVVSK